MSESVLLVFDLTAILAGRTRDWHEFDSLGFCFIPQVVREEINFLNQRASTLEEEKTAREFTRFLAHSSWQIAQSIAEHPSLITSEGNSLSKNARLRLAIAQCVYGMAQENPTSLVVMVSNQANLRSQIENLSLNNLVTLTLAQFLQWLRTKRIPLNISQKISRINRKNTSSGFKINPKYFSSPTSLASAKTQSRIPRYSTSLKKPNPISSLMYSILALVAFTVVGFSVWYLIQPKSFHQFWHQLDLPSLLRE
jgi:hypothetical protein